MRGTLNQMFLIVGSGSTLNNFFVSYYEVHDIVFVIGNNQLFAMCSSHVIKFHKTKGSDRCDDGQTRMTRTLIK